MDAEIVPVGSFFSLNRLTNGGAATQIFTPRQYQVELLDAALSHNTIVCLQTGSGKMFISVMLVKELSKPLRLSLEDGGQKAIYLVNDVSLLHYKANIIREHTDLRVSAFADVPHGDAKAWQTAFAGSQVVLMPADAFSTSLEKGWVRPCQINALILDECHRATGEHPYGAIMRGLRHCSGEGTGLPRILGLTSSVLHGKYEPRRLEERLLALERMLLSTAETYPSGSLSRYCTKPREVVVVCEAPLGGGGGGEGGGGGGGVESLTEQVSELPGGEEGLVEQACEAPGGGEGLTEQVKEMPRVEESITEQIREVPGGGESLATEVRRVLREARSFLEGLQTQHDGSTTGLPLACALQAVADCKDTFRVIGPLGLRIVVPLLLAKLQRLERHETLPLARLLLRFAGTQLRLARKICENVIVEAEDHLDLRFAAPKVRRLLEVLEEFRPSEEAVREDGTAAAAAGQTQPTAKRQEQFPRAPASRKACNSRPLRSQDPQSTYEEECHDSNSEREEDEDEDETGVGTTGGPAETSMYGIVFVGGSLLAVVLDKLVRKLQKRKPRLAFVHSSAILSQGEGLLQAESSQSGPRREQQSKKQEEILRRFRRHEINLLFATTALEEGVDVPKCNLVVRFDAPDHYRSYVQSKGRARAPNSHFVMLVEEGRLEAVTRELTDFQEIDKILQRKCHKREQQLLENAELQQADSLRPPFQPGPGEEAAKVTMTTAISLVNRYCSKLPSDTFTHLSPKCQTEVLPDEEGVTVYRSLIYLPINSPIRDPIQGPPMPKRKLAEMAAALKVCETLHKAGELDDNLLPVNKDTALAMEDLGYDQEVVQEGQGRPGTTKRRQYYNKEVAGCLKGCRPAVGQPCRLYEIHMSLASPLPDLLNVRDRKLHGPEETSRTFGILTTKVIPKIPGFPVYTRAGELAVSVSPLTSDLAVTSEQQLAQLWRFHSCIFAEVLRLEKPNLAFDPEKAEADYVIVPLDRGGDGGLRIDWDFLRLVSESSGMLDRPPVLPDYSRTQFGFDPRVFADAVVTPIYRNIDQPQRYYIAAVLHDLPVTSPFPSDKYEKFVDYYFERYDIQVSNYRQPLLDVDCMSSRLNLLTPRYLNHKGKALPVSRAQSRRHYLQKKQYLVPELCYVYPVPASLWRKAVCLPSILYRLNALLVAEELRLLIAREAGVGQESLPPDRYPFPNMTFGWEGLDLQSLDGTGSPSAGDDELQADLEQRTVGKAESEPEQAAMIVGTCNNGDGGREKKREGEKGNGRPSTVNQTCPGDSVNSEQFLYCTNDGAQERNWTGENCDEAEVGGKGLPNGQCTPEATLDPMKVRGRQCSGALERGSDGGGRTPACSSRAGAGTRRTVLDDRGQEPSGLPGPSPAALLQSLTMSNSSDGFNLERLEMLGDSFLKQAVTVYLYCAHPGRHEGKLSYMRSKQVSNFHLYQLGRRKGVGRKMQVALFDPAINWLAPGFSVRENVAPESRPAAHVCRGDGSDFSSDDEGDAGDFAIGTWDPSAADSWDDPRGVIEEEASPSDQDLPMMAEADLDSDFSDDEPNGGGGAGAGFGFGGGNLGALDPWSFSLEDADNLPGLTYTGRKPEDVGDLPELPYEIHTQHSLSDKNLADAVEALIGCYLVSCGFRSALIVMSWFGLRVLPQVPADGPSDADVKPLDGTAPGASADSVDDTTQAIPGPASSSSTGTCPKASLRYGLLEQPGSPFFRNVPDADQKLVDLLVGMDGFERTINYSFRDKAYLVQAFTHASYHYNCITDCYQRLEFLGDAILDYLITRHLFDHHQDLSPGALTDLRSALVNNTIFASLAVRFGYHKYFKALSPELFHVIDNFVTFVKEKKEALGMGSQLKVLDVEGLQGGSEGESEDIEVPKALGDIFESVAGAVYLDSGMSLDAVWEVYYPLMRPQIEQYAANLPISPVRELLEMEPETARFGPPERTMDGKTRVTVNVVGKGRFKGIGRNYRIAKATAARCALRHLKAQKK